jgi:hypothetical protein
MRDITWQIKYAFNNNEHKKIGNSETDGTSVWLHGNRIIYTDRLGRIWYTMAGWETRTTKERLNGIINAGIWQENYEQQSSVHSRFDPSKWYCDQFPNFALDSVSEIDEYTGR